MHDSDSDLIAGLPACLSGVLDRLDRSTYVDSVGFGISVRRLFIIIYHESHLLSRTKKYQPSFVFLSCGSYCSRDDSDGLK